MYINATFFYVLGILGLLFFGVWSKHLAPEGERVDVWRLVAQGVFFLILLWLCHMTLAGAFKGGL